MKLVEQIEEDFKQSLKSKNEIVVSTLRLLKSAIKNKEIEQKKELNEDDILALVLKEIKKRQESAGIYQKAGRGELRDKEIKEIGVLKKYAPENLSEAELERIIKEEVANLKASGPSDMGKVMGKVMARVQGRASGSIVSKKVTELLK